MGCFHRSESPLTESNRRPSPYHGHRASIWPGNLPLRSFAELRLCGQALAIGACWGWLMAPGNGSRTVPCSHGNTLRLAQ